MKEKKALDFCSEYHPERQWCKKFGIDYTDLEEEKKFQENVKLFQFKEKRT